MMEYVARFIELVCFADDYVAIDMAKVRRFENELRLSIRGRIVGLCLQNMDSMVGTAMTIKKEKKVAHSTREASVSGKRKRVGLLPVWERSRGLLVTWVIEPRSFGPGTNQGCHSSRTYGMFPLPAARTYEEGLPSETGTPGFRGRAVPVSRGTRADTFYSSTP